MFTKVLQKCFIMFSHGICKILDPQSTFHQGYIKFPENIKFTRKTIKWVGILSFKIGGEGKGEKLGRGRRGNILSL